MATSAHFCYRGMGAFCYRNVLRYVIGHWHAFQKRGTFALQLELLGDNRVLLAQRRNCDASLSQIARTKT
jgi:hypothetical protein